MTGQLAAPAGTGDPTLAAAVLSVFDLDWVAPDPTDAEAEALADFLVVSCERVVDETGVPRWRLRDDERARVFRSIPRDRLRDVLRGLAARPDDAVQRLLEQYLDGTVPPLDELDADELGGLWQLLRWVEAGAGLPHESAVRTRLDRLAVTAPLERLLERGFVGRADILAELQEFAEHGAPSGLFVLKGVGGAGKSTVLARFLLDRMARGDLAAYLNYDRGWLIDGGPWTLLDEILRHVAAQDPEAGDWATELRRDAQAGSRGKYGYREIASRARQSWVRVPTRLLAALGSRLSPEQVLVVVIDTLEELVRREGHYADEIYWFLTDLQQEAPGVRVVLAGRAVPEELAREGHARRLAGLGEADAVHLLRMLVPGEDERVLTEIARRVEGNPLSLHLAADVLRRTGTSPVRLLAVGEGNVQGQLYARLLEHIPDPRVRAIAHPGLVVRRITAEVILRVLAEPCGIAPLNLAQAHELFSSLRQEATLCEPSPDGDGSLVHRQDVRAIMLPAIQQDSPGTTAQIHQAAVRYYIGRPSPGASEAERRVMRREELYHRLMLKDERHRLDERWAEEAGRELATVVEELPKRSQAYLVSRVHGLRLDPAVRAAADDDEWCHSVRPAAEAQLERHLVAEALKLVRERRGADGRSLLPDLEIEALERLGRVDEALALAAEQYEIAIRRGSHRAMREMLMHQARILERLRQWNEASAILTELAQLDRERRARTDRLDEQVRTRELVVLTSLLRIARHQGRDDIQTEALVAETVAVAETTPPRTLVRAPSLLRDLGAEIGRHSPAILALASTTLADTSEMTKLHADKLAYDPGVASTPWSAININANGLTDPREAPEESDWSARFAADSDLSQSYLWGHDYPHARQDESEYRAAVQELTEQAGPEAADTLTVRTTLADLLQAQGRLEEAELEYRAVIEARTRTLGAEHSTTIGTRYRLAGVLEERDQLDEAETEYRAVVQALTEQAGPEAADTLTVRTTRADLLQAQGRLEEAELEYRAVIEARTRIVGADHLTTLVARSNLGHVLQARGRLEEAESEYRGVLEGLLRTAGLDADATQAARLNLAGVLRARGRLEEAELEYRAVIEARILGAEHSTTIGTRYRLAGVLEERDQLDEAETEYRAVVQALTEQAGPEAADTLTVRTTLADLLQAQGRLEEAELEYRAVIEARTRTLGAEHSTTIGTRYRLAGVLEERDQLDEAETEYRAVVQALTEQAGPEAADTLTVRTTLADLLQAQGRLEETESGE